ncbi:unnamed protein product, partial [Heterosigma akashiwo]
SIHLSWSIYGSRENPPLLLLHGFMGCKQDWEPFIKLLMNQFCCILIDLPGHGLPPKICVFPCIHTILLKNTIQLYRVLESLGITQCCVVGYSMGGRLGLFLAKTYPNIFICASIISANPGIQSLIEKERRWESDLNLASKKPTGLWSMLDN